MGYRCNDTGAGCIVSKYVSSTWTHYKGVYIIWGSVPFGKSRWPEVGGYLTGSWRETTPLLYNDFHK